MASAQVQWITHVIAHMGVWITHFRWPTNLSQMRVRRGTASHDWFLGGVPVVIRLMPEYGVDVPHVHRDGPISPPGEVACASASIPLRGYRRTVTVRTSSMRKGDPSARRRSVPRIRFSSILWVAAIPIMVASSFVLSYPATAAVQTIPAAQFARVACVSTSECLAVGNLPFADSLGANSKGVAASLDPVTGNVSKGQSVQDFPSAYRLSGVACATSSLCIAVGFPPRGVRGGVTAPLDPTTGELSLGQSIQTIAGVTNFDAVACSSPTQCLAVGTTAVTNALVQPHLIAVPIDPATGGISAGQAIQVIPGTLLNSTWQSVTCPAPTQCLAVGVAHNGTGMVVPLDPVTGAISANQSAQTISGIGDLRGVACASATQCLAAGVGAGGNGTPDGGVAVPLDPATGAISAGQSLQHITGIGYFLDVACSATSCVGSGENGGHLPNSPAAQGQVVSLDPATGTVSPNQRPVTIAGAGFLFGVACTTATQCLTVGLTIANPGNVPQAGIADPLDLTTLDPPVDSGPYHPLPPTRICDTRPVSSFNPANQCNSPEIQVAAPGGVDATINVANDGNGGTGTYGVPDNATSVVLNVTATNAIAGGFLTVYPAGAALPNASNVNYQVGETVPNLVEVGTGSGGDVVIHSSPSDADLVVDVEGYTAPIPGGNLYDALSSPNRICDSRAASTFTSANQCEGPGQVAGTLGAAVPKVVTVVNGTTIPDGATAAVLNVTVANPTADGFLTVAPQGSQEPNASNLNYSAGETTANRVIVRLSASGKIALWSSTPTDVIVDVSGYFTPVGGTGGTQLSSNGPPLRVCDTRPAGTATPINQCTSQTITPGGVLNVSMSAAGFPSNATAVIVNVTGISPTESTFLTVFPEGIGAPNSSDLNLGVGETKANLVVATLSDSGQISIANAYGDVDIAVDVLGWYS
jgi:hypothetical protein